MGSENRIIVKPQDGRWQRVSDTSRRTRRASGSPVDVVAGMGYTSASSFNAVTALIQWAEGQRTLHPDVSVVGCGLPCALDFNFAGGGVLALPLQLAGRGLT